MRIGMILDKTFPPDPRVENEAISLIKAGYEVFLFCLNYNEAQNDEIIEGIHVKRYPSNKLEYKLSALAYTFSFYTNIMAKKIAHFLRSNAIDALHIHDIRIAEAALKANKEFDLPTVLDLHDNLPEIMKYYPHLQKFPGKYLISPKKWKKKEEEFINSVSKVVTVSDEFKQEVLNRVEIDHRKIVVVPNTVRPSFYQDPIENEGILDRYRTDFVILYLGDTGLRRGLLTAIQSMAELKEHIPNIKLVIVGSNSTDAILKEEAITLGVDSSVDFQGWQDVKLFPAYIQASSVCISPLTRNIQHDVAYANKLFQYMSFAKPLLVSNAIAQKNLVEKVDCGLIHEEKNAADFSEKVLKLYESEELRERLGMNGKRFIENEFNWEITSKSLVDLYRSLTD